MKVNALIIRATSLFAAFEAIVDSCHVIESVEATRIAMETNRQAVEATKTHTQKLKLAMGDSEVTDFSPYLKLLQDRLLNTFQKYFSCTLIMHYEG